MNLPPDPRSMATKLVVEAPAEILDAPRTILADEFCAWLEDSGLVDGLPPGEIVVSITPGKDLPHDLGIGIACFVVARGPSLNDRWEIAVAYGEDHTDEHDVAAWLVSIPHELLHLSGFIQRYDGRVPMEVGEAKLRADEYGLRSETEEDRVEEEARSIVDAFLGEYPDRCCERRLLRGLPPRGPTGPKP